MKIRDADLLQEDGGVFAQLVPGGLWTFQKAKKVAKEKRKNDGFWLVVPNDLSNIRCYRFVDHNDLSTCEYKSYI